MTCSCSLYTLHPALNSRLGMILSHGTKPHIVQQEILVPLITIIPVQASSILNLSCPKCVYMPKQDELRPQYENPAGSKVCMISILRAYKKHRRTGWRRS